MPLVDPAIEKKIEQFIEQTVKIDTLAQKEKEQAKKIIAAIEEKEGPTREQIAKLESEIKEYFDGVLDLNEEYKKKIKKFEFTITKSFTQTPKWKEYISGILELLNKKARKVAEDMKDDFRDVKLKLKVKQASHRRTAGIWESLKGFGKKMLDKAKKMFGSMDKHLDDLMDSLTDKKLVSHDIRRIASQLKLAGGSLAIIKKKFEDFEKAQYELREFGASDSEPDWVFQDIIRQIIKGDKAEIPASANDWQIFSNMKGSNRAAKILSSKTEALVKAIQNVTVAELQEVREYLKGQCHRVDFD